MRLSAGKLIGYTLLAILAGSLLYSLFGANTGEVKNIPLSQVVEDALSGRIEKIVVKGDNLIITDRNGVEYHSRKEANTSLFDAGINPQKVTIEVQDVASTEIWMSILSSLIPFILIFGFLYFMLRQAQGANNQALSFGRSRARLVPLQGKNRITFNDVAGAFEAKQELMEEVEFLKYPSKFLSIGARIPKGVLLMGPPGTGKTLLAKAVAGEAGVPFFHISGSEFVEMFVGVGASRVRDLFAKAKRNAPAIVFIDEIDAVGRQRGTGLGGSHDEREQTLNQILVEMDGFETDTNVIVIAATNRPDVLDPALLRPGRFDRRVMLERPDIKDRLAILQVHAKNKPLAKAVDLEQIAKQTPGFSGADLENLMNEAAILAAKKDQKEIKQHDIEMSVEKVQMGPERKSHVLSKKEKEVTAYHETGHAIVGHLLPECDPLRKITIISRGMSLGSTWFVPEEDKHLVTREKFEHEMASLLGGYVAEEMIYGQVSTGPSNDLERASSMARRMVTEYGMSSQMGPTVFGEKSHEVFLGRDYGHVKNYSEEKAAESLERAVESAGAGTLPEINPLSNPLEKMPDVNPVNRANPFKDVKTNPFE